MNILTKALQLIPLSEDEALTLYEHAPTDELMDAAAALRRLHVPGNGVSWQIDRNVNYTNVCISGCLFCNFHCKPHETDKSYTTTMAEYDEKIATLFAKGGNQLLLQGGLHPAYRLPFYELLFRTLKTRYPALKLHALGPPEVAHIARLEKCSYREVLQRLMAAGLDSLPGAGAEILIDRVRKIISPAKPDAQAWLDVMREAHRLKLTTSATMLIGHIETNRERIRHLLKLRDLQAEKPESAAGFLNFICWPVQTRGTLLAQRYPLKPVTPVEYIRTVAISRIVLNNIKNIQASWLTVGRDTAQVCLHAGANDMGSIMIEENVLASAGVSYRMDAEGIRQTIREAGFEPWLRNQQYELIAN
ncbi:MAG: CofH family radical SAM protein [Prevotellaceae bacterium]|jgi:cyclic dehypoxanthinyl futalosine synthase|nr:CofH family radical SAM protein [Prevotellaceae bacterium]